MAQKIIVVGAGLIGASVAWQMTRAGADVTVVEAGLPAAMASGRSFGWINAGFYLDETHYHLRAEGIAAWHRLEAELPELALNWCGGLSWDVTGVALEDRVAELTRLGYPVERWARPQIAERFPALAGEIYEALWCPTEGIAESGAVTRTLLTHACSKGAKLITGTAVTGVAERAGVVCGVETAAGPIEGDRVVLAAGTGVAALLEPLGVQLPMLTRPGALVRTRPVEKCLEAVMVAPDLEFRQDAEGRIIAPSAAAHQSDDSEVLDAPPDALAEDTLARVRRWLPNSELTWDEVKLAMRPVPGDGRPVVGPCGPEGLNVAVMHSGVTLGTLMGELVAQEVLTGQGSDWLTPYRIGRFASD